MKRKFVKSIAYFIVAVLVLLSVSGCSQNSGTNSENSNSDIAISRSEYSTENVTESQTEQQTEHLSEVPNGYIGIYTVEDLKNSTFNTEANYILMNDLDLSSIANWEGINNKSIFDGNNYTISNLKSTKSGLFLEANNIYNLNVKNVDININERNVILGALACKAVQVFNCISSGEINVNYNNDHAAGPYTRIGGLVGYTEEKIKNCKSGVAITHTVSHIDNYIGGISGISPKKIEDCEFFGTINCKNASAGGITGSANRSIEIINCSNKGTINCVFQPGYWQIDWSELCLGGIVGYVQSDAIISNCFNIGDISSKISTDKAPDIGYCFGGIIGASHISYNSLNIQNCYNAGKINVEGNNKKIGAITGSDKTDDLYIRNCAYLKNDIYGITSTNAMFANCKAMTENEMHDINNYPFNNINEWKNVQNSYPIYNYIDE